jgi:hypothetical protein
MRWDSDLAGFLFSHILRRAWLAAVRRAHLTKIEPSKEWFDTLWLRARSGSLLVQLDRYLKLEKPGTHIRISRLQHSRQGLTVHRKALGPPAGIELGDPAFTEEFHVGGPAPLVLAALDAETRRRLANLLRGVVQVDGREPIEVSASLTDGVLEGYVEHTGMTVEQIADQAATAPRWSDCPLRARRQSELLQR